MNDLIKLRPHQLFLTTEAAGKVDGFKRSHHTRGRLPGGTIIQAFDLNGYHPVKIVAQRTNDGRYWVAKIEAVFPAVLHGHNGRPIRTIEDLWMALAIVQHIGRRVTEPACHERIIPGVGRYNLGYIDYLECSVTIEYPGHRFILGSHFARLQNQQRATRIYLGESSRLSIREAAVSIYDKQRQLREGFTHPADTEATRIEATVALTVVRTAGGATAGIAVGGAGGTTHSPQCNPCLIRKSSPFFPEGMISRAAFVFGASVSTASRAIQQLLKLAGDGRRWMFFQPLPDGLRRFLEGLAGGGTDPRADAGVAATGGNAGVSRRDRTLGLSALQRAVGGDAVRESAD